MGKINVLPFAVANLIAAGEVVDRPASVIKELMENAIDAHARRVTVEIQNGGVTFMRVSDDGCGMEADDLPVAIRRHATSKIHDASDLDGIATLGFRGEALAAIASVSEMRILSKRHEDDMGSVLVASGGEIVSLSEAGCMDGTTVIVEALFANVPARRKFLKKDMTEAQAVTAAVERVALSHPEISFKLIVDGEIRMQTAGDSNLRSAVFAVFGRDFTNRLIPISGEYEGIGVSGFIGRSDNVKGNRNYQNFFINGRWIKSKTAMAALEQAFCSYLPQERYPVCVMNITLDPARVDVNVHPAKLEVKFSNEKLIFEAIYYTVRHALEQNETRPDLKLPAAVGGAGKRETFADQRRVSDAFAPVNDRALGKKQEQMTLDTVASAPRFSAASPGSGFPGAFGASETSGSSGISNAPGVPGISGASAASAVHPTPAASAASGGGQPAGDDPHAGERMTAEQYARECLLASNGGDNAAGPRSFASVGGGQTASGGASESPAQGAQSVNGTQTAQDARIAQNAQGAAQDVQMSIPVPSPADGGQSPAPSARMTRYTETAWSGVPTPPQPLTERADASAQETALPRFDGAVGGMPDVPGEVPGEAPGKIPGGVPDGNLGGEETIFPDGASGAVQTGTSAEMPPDKPPAPWRIVGEVFHSYVLVETGNRMLIIDQHAAHERVLFEQLKARLHSTAPAAQMLMIPLEIMLMSDEVAALGDFREELTAIGFELEMARNTVTIHALPVGIETDMAGDMLAAIADRIKNNTGSARLTRDILFEKALYQGSCKAAIKAGRVYAEGHLEWLVGKLMELPDITFCPHGRPVAMEVTKQNLDHQFERT